MKFQFTLNEKVWIISDLHYNHANIIKYCNRPFYSVYHMNNTLISNWNRVVSKNDIVFHLGDWVFGQDKETKAKELYDKLNGDIFFLPGNHDKKIVIPNKTITKEYEIIYYDTYKIAISHYPETKIKQDHDIHCYGHVHNHEHDPVTKGFNCSVENINYTPILLSEIIKEIQNGK